MQTRFLSCDWGTSSFRLRLVERTPAGPVVVEEIRSADGVAAVHDRGRRDGLSREETFGRALRSHLEPIATARRDALHGADGVIISGMAGSTLGWRDVPYARVPFELDGTSIEYAAAGAVDVGGMELRVLILGGVASAQDIARGEEVELLGILQSPAWQRFAGACLAVLPGTHSKHMLVRDGAVVGFKTYLSGELHALLVEHSVLRHSVLAGAELDEAALADGVRQVLADGLLGSLFSVRARHVLGGVSPRSNLSYLTGLVLGAEAGELTRLESASVPILLCASSTLAARYQLAIETAGLGSRLHVVPPAEVELASVRGHELLLRIIERKA